MTLDSSTVTKAISALRARGFAYDGRHNEKNLLMFRGNLACDGVAYPIILSVDPKGLALPLVRLIDVPAKLLPFAPHLSADGNLC